MKKSELKQLIKETISELTQPTDQRYVVTMNFYIYAKDNISAIALAKHIAEKEDQKYDNAALVLTVESQPYGELGSKIIYDAEKDHGEF
jgi:hypothetical protein